MTTTATYPANADFRALEEIHAAALRALPAEVAGYQVLRRTELLHGVCPDCQQKRSGASVTADC